MTVHRVLKENLLYPYRLQKVQELLPADYQKRVVYCRWMLQKCEESPDFLSNILYTDESSFTRNGIFNSHNSHRWAEQNPNGTVVRHHQRQCRINIWAGIIGGTLIGPFELPRILNGAEYLHFLINSLPGLLEDVPLQTRQGMYFLQDGAPPHCTQAVREELNRQYPNRWIGSRGAPISWPARSPDLNPLDFYLWGQLKDLVYSVPINDEDHLRARIEESADFIKRNMFRGLMDNYHKRLITCLNENGQHFEQLL